MAVLLRMPKLSDTMSEGTIAKWLKGVGDAVSEGDLLLEVETDKATMEYHAPDDGHLLQILVTDEAVDVGAPIAVFGAKDEKFELDTLLGKTKQSATAETVPESTPKQSKQIEHSEQDDNQATQQVQKKGGRVRSSPLARKIAAASGLALQAVRGTGPRGRVVARDVVKAKTGASGEQTGVVSRVPNKQKITTLRRTIAKRLTVAKSEAPHFYLQRSVDVRQLLRVRAKFNHAQEQKLNLNTLISYVCVRSLLQHPEVNSSWNDGKEIIEHRAVHLATAVAMPNGLVTPVVRDSDTMTLVEFSKSLDTVVAAARASKLTNEDLLGGTFTISNLGMFGIESFTAIINPPQAAILAVGAVRDKLALEQGQISVQKEMTLTLSCDHRVVDGAMGARFLATLASNLELPFFI